MSGPRLPGEDRALDYIVTFVAGGGVGMVLTWLVVRGVLKRERLCTRLLP